VHHRLSAAQASLLAGHTVPVPGRASAYLISRSAEGGGLNMFNGWILGLIAVAAVVFVIVWIINIRKDKAKP
jgi:hypothetical protein